MRTMAKQELLDIPSIVGASNHQGMFRGNQKALPEQEQGLP